MTRSRERAQHPPAITLALGPVPQDTLDTCARLLARLAVEKVLSNQPLDTGPTKREDVGNPHKEAPPSVDAPGEAKE
jgi:hypothetical protein